MSALQQALGERLLQAATAVEEKIDEELNKYEKISEDDLEAIRQKRLKELRQRMRQKKEWLENEHGKYEELPDEKSFFEATKKSNRIVCHFYLSGSERCKIVDKHLKELAPKHLETRFVRVNAEKFPFITQRLDIRVIPTIAIVIDSKTVDYIRGFTDLGGVDDFKTGTLEWRLGWHGAIDYDGPSYLSNSEGKKTRILKKNARTVRSSTADDTSDDDY
ncbi:unnamed protein product [Enterobius vermicularis]|uniref:Thioredoxin domain-containing protein 9 n=1 Tax=Enterobius vermicularis TaxID=51028 RepID=A0A0N4UX66_ENTVE|nr:unnamed protein product [Enterobius vermicularis]